MEFSKKDDEAVKWCEDNYPEMTQEYKKIMMEQYILFCKKHRNYGTSNINVGTNLDTDSDVKLALTGESSIDTYQDLSVYGIIAQIVSQKKFK